MRSTAAQFKQQARAALAQPELKIALNRTTGLLTRRRAEVIADFPEYETVRETARRIKDHTLGYLDFYLE